jgi:hypothetical protein
MSCTIYVKKDMAKILKANGKQFLGWYPYHYIDCEPEPYKKYMATLKAFRPHEVAPVESFMQVQRELKAWRDELVQLEDELKTLQKWLPDAQKRIDPFKCIEEFTDAETHFHIENSFGNPTSAFSKSMGCLMEDFYLRARKELFDDIVRTSDCSRHDRWENIFPHVEKAQKFAKYLIAFKKGLQVHSLIQGWLHRYG